jgi:hypothetical protein
MKKILILLTFLITLPLPYLAVKYDIWIHPWIPTVVADWQWWNYFSSEHSMTVLFIVHPIPWMVLSVLMSLLFTLVITSKLR